MKRNDGLKFLPVGVTPELLVETVLSFSGLAYCEKVSHMEKDEAGNWVGFANCFGVLLMAAKLCGLLPEDFNINLPPALWGQSEVKSLWEIIDFNFDKVPRELMAPGDVLLMQYKDVDPTLNEPHHVLMCVGKNKIFHASNTVGYCYSCDIDPLYELRIDSIWRCRNFLLPLHVELHGSNN